MMLKQCLAALLQPCTAAMHSSNARSICTDVRTYLRRLLLTFSMNLTFVNAREKRNKIHV